jgi:hypothetical protein
MTKEVEENFQFRGESGVSRTIRTIFLYFFNSKHAIFLSLYFYKIIYMYLDNLKPYDEN